MSADLDDFFAKKDKKKGKKSTKGISNEDFVQKYEAKCKDSNNKENKSAIVLNNLEGFIQGDDDEWKDFEDENKDYSGLKIQVLTINDDEEREKEEEEDVKKNTTETPWGKKESEGNNDNIESENKQDDSEEKSESEKNSESKAEEPKQGLSLIELMLQSRRLRLEKQQAQAQGPRLDDSNEFPDLGATPEEIEDSKTFQPVRTGLRSSMPPPPPNPASRHRGGFGGSNDSFSTDNKFNLLRHNH